MKKQEYGIIGYGNHAKRLIKIIENIKNCNIKYIYTNKTNDFYKLKNECDVIVIASPDNTHCDYIKKLQEFDYKGYIFCEKPPAINFTELNYLKNLTNSEKEKIYFNFNYRFLKLNEFLFNNNIKIKFGELIHVDIVSSHGLAFKDSYKNSWRSLKNNKYSILQSVGIHYIDLFNTFIGYPDEYNCKLSNFANIGNSFDTCNISMNYKYLTINMLLSYAMPYQQNIRMFGTNGIIDITDKNIILYSPRENFDKNGNFIKPKIREIVKYNFDKDYNASLVASLEYFNKFEKNNKLLYDLSIKSNELMLDMTI